MVEIRRATDTDSECVHAVLADAFAPFESQYTPRAYEATVAGPELIRRRLREGPVWLAWAADQPVGTVGLRREADGFYLRGMGVAGAARGTGCGRRLLEVALAWSQAGGPCRVWLPTTAFLPAAVHLYRKSGFVEIEGLPAQELHGVPLVAMEWRPPVTGM